MNTSLYSNHVEYIIGIQFGMEETAAAICRIDANYYPEDYRHVACQTELLLLAVVWLNTQIIHQ